MTTPLEPLYQVSQTLPFLKDQTWPFGKWCEATISKPCQTRVFTKCGQVKSSHDSPRHTQLAWDIGLQSARHCVIPPFQSATPPSESTAPITAPTLSDKMSCKQLPAAHCDIMK